LRSVKHNGSESLEVLLEKYNFNSVAEVNELGWSILHYAAVENRCDLVRELVTIHQLPVDIPSSVAVAIPRIGNGGTPLMAAAGLGSAVATDVVATLVGLKADIHATDSNGNTPLYQALVQKNAPMAMALVDAGADINGRSSGRLTPLHVAALACPAAIAPFVAAGAKDGLTVGCTGVVSLLAASSLPGPACAEYLLPLLAAKCDINGMDHLPFATGEMPKPLMSVLRIHQQFFRDDHCAVPLPSDGAQPPLKAAIDRNNPGCAMALLEVGADPYIAWAGRTMNEWARFRDRTGREWQDFLRITDP